MRLTHHAGLLLGLAFASPLLANDFYAIGVTGPNENRVEDTTLFRVDRNRAKLVPQRALHEEPQFVLCDPERVLCIVGAAHLSALKTIKVIDTKTLRVRDIALEYA